ncbi:hypothetical protein MKEN_00014200 [Mycena kentingensis (nom. inval.)]|nr:hypothetical protein MKEN_00014200 [Mycena kentingensis (nom. inval.)]
MDDNYLPPSSPPAESPPDSPRDAPRTLFQPTNFQQGSAFHELVVAPTFLPQHAQPYWDPLSQHYINPATPFHGVPAPAPAATAASPAAVPSGWVSVNAVVIRIEFEQPTTRRGHSKPKTVEDPRITAEKGNVGAMTRQEFLDFALKPHGRDGVYRAQDTGPGFKVYWAGTGSIGGKKNAPLIRDESSWLAVRGQLVAVLGRSKNLSTIQAIFDLAAMDPFKFQNRAHSVERADNHLELTFGTMVPNMANVSADAAALGAKVQEILAKHACLEDRGSCFIMEDGRHIPLNRFRVRPWAEACLISLATPDAPTLDILQDWDANTISTVPNPRAPKPRGRMGPGVAPTPAAASSDAAMAAVLATTQLASTMMAQLGQQSGAVTPRIVAAAPSPPRSSPPPAVEDELDTFIERLRKSRNIVLGEDAVEGLRKHGYSPDLLVPTNTRISDARLVELTALSEGEVMQMRDFAFRWANRVEGKRVRRKIDF